MKFLFILISVALLSGCDIYDKYKSFIMYEYESGYRFSNNIIVWPHGEIPYCFDSKISYEHREKITRCLDTIEKNTKCIYFIQSDSDHAVTFYYSKEYANWGTLGKNSVNFVKLRKPIEQRAIYHETLHVLGLRHEHQRYDSSEFINILYENIFPEYRQAFSPADHLYDIDEIPYDTKSIMHYPPDAFSTTVSIEFLSDSYQRSDTPTDLDYKKIKAIYNN